MSILKNEKGAFQWVWLWPEDAVQGHGSSLGVFASASGARPWAQGRMTGVPVLGGFSKSRGQSLAPLPVDRVALLFCSREGRGGASLPVSHLSVLLSLEEVVFRKKRLCIKFIPRDSTEAAICDIRIMGRTKQAPPQYTFIG